MTITINGNDIELNFGIRFIYQLDSKHHTSVNGIDVGTGLEELVPKLIAGDIMALCEVIYTAMWGAKPKKPTLDEMYDFMDSAEDIEALTAEVLEELKNWNATKKRAAEMVASMTAVTKAQAAKITKTSTKK